MVVIGIGNELRGDDGAGPEVARRLRARDLPPAVSVRSHQGEGPGLLALWEGAGSVVLIDAVSSDAEAGTVRRLDASSAPLPIKLRHSSTHAVGPGEAIELARALHRLPPRVIFYGVEATSFEAGAAISDRVASALGSLADSVWREALELAAAAG